MSDCSTAAMKPKMPPKTCDTCQHHRYCHTPAESSLAEVCARFRPEGEPTVPKYAPITETCDTCPERIMEDGCKVKARCYDLGQRCQQLEQMALDMLDDMAFPIEWVCDGEMRNRIENTIGFHKHRLESLGVSVDE